MATTKIRGITIELGADTSGLNKALTDVNKQIGTTQRELRDVDKLLKMDPGNTELLAQKHRMLGERVDEAKTKLEALRNSQAEINDLFARGEIDQGQYDAFVREIISVENELKELEKRAAESNVALQQISDIGNKFQNVGSKISSVGDGLTKNVTAPIAGLGAAAIKITADFDAAMSKVRAISGATEDDFERLRAKAREMGETTKFSATDSANAMEYMAMAGWKTEEMLSGIEGIMNLAAASGEDLATTSDIVTDALTAFGLTASDAGDFADLLAQTSANANTNVSMMGETFKYAATNMGAMGYSAEDTALAIGLMGNAGIKASNAGTALRGVVTRLAKPTDESKAAMKRLGIELYNEEGKMNSFYDVMEQMRAGFSNIKMPVQEFNETINNLDLALEDGTITQKQYDKQLDELILQAYGAEEAEKARAAAMLAGKNALSGMLAIVNASDEDFYKLKDAIDSSGGAAENMATIMQDNAAGQVEILMSQLQELAISMGDILIPVFREVVGIVQNLVDKFNSLDESQKETIVKVLAVAAAFGPLLSIFGRVASGIGAIMKLAPMLGPVFSTIGSAIGALASPIGIIVAAVVALVALIATKGDEMQKYLQKADDFLQNIFAKDFTKIFGSVLGEQLNAFMAVLKGVWDGIKTGCDGIINFIRGIFTGDWERAWTGVKQIFKGTFDSFVALAKAPLNGVIALINTMIDKINSFGKSFSGLSFKNPFTGETVGFSIPSIPKIPYLAAGGTVTGGAAIVGEAGAELLNVQNGAATVTPLTGGNNADLTNLLENIYSAVLSGQNIYLDGNTLVGSTADRMNNALGRIAVRSGNR